MPFGTDKAIHQAASGAQTEALTFTCWRIYWPCSGTRKPPSWLFYSGFLCLVYFDSLNLLVMLVSVSIFSFVKQQSYQSYAFEYSLGFEILSKEISTLSSRWQNEKKGEREMDFLSLLSLPLHFISIFHILQTHKAWSLGKCHFPFSFLLMAGCVFMVMNMWLNIAPSSLCDLW